MSDILASTRPNSAAADDEAPAPHLPDSAQEDLEERLISSNRLTPQQVEQVRALQRRHNSSFVDAALAIGLVRREQIFEALSRHYNYPIFGPTFGGERFSRDLVVGFDAFGAQAEAVRSTRTALVSAAIDAKTNSMAFIGAKSGSGVTYLAANLALSLAQAGIRTLLVDANLRRPRIGPMFGLDRSREGLTEALNYGLTETPPLAVSVVPNLSVMPAGMLPPNPQELLASPEFRTLSVNLRRRFGVVVYDVTSIDECVDGLIVGAVVGAAVLVARRHKSSVAEISSLAAALRGQHCSILGSVLDG